MKTAIIYIDRELKGAFWEGRQVSIEMAECILNQYKIMGYTTDNHGTDGIFVLVKQSIDEFMKKLNGRA